MNNTPPIHIYVIQHIDSNKIYVGQSVNLRTRFATHRHRVATGKTHLYCAMRSYGLEALRFTHIETYATLEEANDAETFWIDFFRSWDRDFGYNHDRSGRNAIPTAETREKMRQAKLGSRRVFTEEHKTNMKKARKGIQFSAEHKANLSQSHTGNRPTKETRAKMSASAKKWRANVQ